MLKTIRFIAIMLAALTLGLGFCHLMQLPARMAWDQYLWVGSTVQGGLYAMFGSVGAIIFVGAVIALGLLAYFVHEHRRPGFQLALTAALLFALAMLLWWGLVYPANVQLASWVNGEVPPDWTDWRDRWEWGHAVIALVELAGFAALVGSVLADTEEEVVRVATATAPQRPAAAIKPKRRVAKKR
ncbi:MAG TPA: DUF1772 domain-containing protein [Methyloceanibacter sp.]|nr:DUF1772 domain-containing protein [Methyloceanibacter sp.]